MIEKEKKYVRDFLDFDAIIFDCDGTLVDTMPLHYAAWSAVLERYDLAFSEERFFQMGGISTEKTAAILAREKGVVLDAKAVAGEKDARFLLDLHQVKPIERVVKYARDAYPHRPLAVATGASRKCAELELRQAGILDLFKVIVTAEDVKNHKPSPDVYLEAALRLGVRPERCLAFDDTPIGLQAARDAGMLAVDVVELIYART